MIFYFSACSLPPLCLALNSFTPQIYVTNTGSNYELESVLDYGVNKLDRLFNIHVHYHWKLIKSQRLLIVQGALMQCNRLCCLSPTTHLASVTVFKVPQESANKCRDAAGPDKQRTPQGAAYPSSFWNRYRIIGSVLVYLRARCLLQNAFELVVESKFNSQILGWPVISSYYGILLVIHKAISNVHW